MSSPGGGSPPGNESDTGAVATALASLRREHRQVIVCTFYEHLSADDAAARLGIPVRDVKRRACSALDEIRRILEERGVQVPSQAPRQRQRRPESWPRENAEGGGDRPLPAASGTPLLPVNRHCGTTR
jgi:Sigma-70, region 4